LDHRSLDGRLDVRIDRGGCEDFRGAAHGGAGGVTMEIINWRMASHPMNWLTIFLMVFIAMFAVRLIAGDAAASKVPGPKLQRA